MNNLFLFLPKQNDCQATRDEKKKKKVRTSLVDSVSGMY